MDESVSEVDIALARIRHLQEDGADADIVLAEIRRLEESGKADAVFALVRRLKETERVRVTGAAALYRSRHRIELRNARRIASALMTLRRLRPPRWNALRAVAVELNEFLSKKELALLEIEVSKARRRPRRPPGDPRKGPFAPCRSP